MAAFIVDSSMLEQKVLEIADLKQRNAELESERARLLLVNKQLRSQLNEEELISRKAAKGAKNGAILETALEMLAEEGNYGCDGMHISWENEDDEALTPWEFAKSKLEEA